MFRINKCNIKQTVQTTGRFMSSMIMPNIGAFIAWGLITALFIPNGWLPVKALAELVDPMLKYLLPILIAYTAGKNIAGERGGVAGAVSVVGVIVGSDIPMFLGAMLMGPIAGVSVKYFDKLIEGKVKSGFEMLVNNFSVGIIAMLLAILGSLIVGNLVEWLTLGISSIANSILELKLLPLVSIIVEPAKVLFLNNAINHGIFSPIGIEQVSQFGQSIFFLIEANPGAGLGMLLACCFAGKGKMKESASGAAIIHFFGGIHEIYFPYVLAKPSLILATIAGSASGLLFFNLTNAGLVAPASPGSIISLIAMSPSDKIWSIILGVCISAVVSFIVSYLILKTSTTPPITSTTTSSSTSSSTSSTSTTISPSSSSFISSTDSTSISTNTFTTNSTSPSSTTSTSNSPATTTTTSTTSTNTTSVATSTTRDASTSVTPLHILFVCDAGMGSSALGATNFRKRVEKAGLNVKVSNCSVRNIPEGVDVIVCQEIIAAQIKDKAGIPEIIEIQNFLSDSKLDALFERLSTKKADDKLENLSANKTDDIFERLSADKEKKSLILRANVLTGIESESKEDAIRRAGCLLHQSGYVDSTYIEAMIERENISPTYMGLGVAIPHGTAEAKNAVLNSGVVILQYPSGVEWGEEKANVIIGIAGVGDEHLEILSKLCEILEDEEKLSQLCTCDDSETIFKLIQENDI